MTRSIDLCLIAMYIEKKITFSVEDNTTLDEISEELVKLYKDSEKSSFSYRKTDDPKELALPP